VCPFSKPISEEDPLLWWYRNHIVNDLDAELPLVETTLQANKDEKKVGLSLLEKLCQNFSLPTEVVAGDANYDVEAILRYIIEEMKAEAMIPRNPRNTQDTHYTLKKDGVYCQAALPVYRKGKMTVKGITYLQYSCPLHWRKEFRGQYLLCPAGHHKFLRQKGRNVLIRMTPSIR